MSSIDPGEWFPEYVGMVEALAIDDPKRDGDYFKATEMRQLLRLMYYVISDIVNGEVKNAR